MAALEAENQRLRAQLESSFRVGERVLVVHVAPFTSTAMLITDASHALPVRVNRSGLRAIAVGTGSPSRLELLHLPVNADVDVGDLLVTSGLGGSFPPGYPVATVEKVERNAGGGQGAVEG